MGILIKMWRKDIINLSQLMFYKWLEELHQFDDTFGGNEIFFVINCYPRAAL